MIQFNEIDAILQNPIYNSIIITGHSNIDFDSCGSIAAFSNLVEEHYGMSCDVAIDGKVLPLNMHYALSNKIDRLVDGTVEIIKKYDLLVVLDCSDKHRIPEGLQVVSEVTDTLVIDHHRSTSDFGTYRFVDPEASAVGIIMYDLAKTVGYTPNRKFADGVMVSIYGDTGSFCNNNTDFKVFEVASEMCKHGAKPNEISRSMFYNNSIKKLKVSSIIYKSVRQFEEGKITLMSVDENSIENLNVSKSDIDGFAESTLRVAGTKIGVYAKIVENGVKFSLRSIPGINVREVAEVFGGGGHDVAAGCKVKDREFSAVWEDMLSELKKRV